VLEETAVLAMRLERWRRTRARVAEKKRSKRGSEWGPPLIFPEDKRRESRRGDEDRRSLLIWRAGKTGQDFGGKGLISSFFSGWGVGSVCKIVHAGGLSFCVFRFCLIILTDRSKTLLHP
jgi:hypothetical protein